MFDLNVIVLIAVGVFGSGVLIALLRGRGQGEVRLVIDGRVFQFPQWAFSAINLGMYEQEAKAVGTVGQWDIIEQRARRRLATLPKEQKAARKHVREALAEARRELALARVSVQGVAKSEGAV